MHVLPHYEVMRFYGRDYYFYDNVFYRFYVEGANDQYEVVVPPSGALVKTLPNDYQTVQINGHEYYLVDDTLYRLTVYDQEPYFEVLGQMPEGWTPSDGTAS